MNHDCILIHFKFFLFSEMQTAFPCIPETVRPFARIQFLLCQIYSSVHNHPCLRSARMSSSTQVWRSPSTTFSLIFSTKEPVGLSTRRNCSARAKTHPTNGPGGFLPKYFACYLHMGEK